MANAAMELSIKTTDGSEYEVTATFSDLVKYDILRARNNFPKREESDFLFMGVVAFAALTRTGQLKNVKLLDFLDSLETIEPANEPVEVDAEETFSVSE